MPGPSQAGKFKPRKPAKKLRVGVAAAAAAVVPDAAPSGRLGGRGGGSGGAASGGGRGGRGRRGPMPQGQAFFTGATKPAEKNTKASKARTKKDAMTTAGSTKSKSKLLVQKKDTESSEEVVGHLEKAIGSSFGKDGTPKASKVESNNFDYEQEGGSLFEDEQQVKYLAEEGCTYDSDSSLEESRPQPKVASIPPSRLPFPVAPLPVGIGSTCCKRPDMYSSRGEKETDGIEMDELQPSPFVDPQNTQGIQAELDSFFLFQFPTRLPALVQQSAIKARNSNNFGDTDMAAQATNKDTAAMMEEEEIETMQPDAAAASEEELLISEVATAPIQPGCFDYVMANAIPGRLGKLLVYKSGKTVLVLQSPDGSTEIRMNISEGLTCSFEQHAVAIDPMKGQYVKLGNVHKTVVVTPDLDNAFSEE